MSTEPLALKRSPVRLTADATWTITRLFWAGPKRARKVIKRVMNLDDEQATQVLNSIRRDFQHLHINLDDIFLAHFIEVARRVDMPDALTDERKRLLGAFFTLEYAFASAALFNPSMTPTINQEGLEPGALRFAMSLRCVGEGHVSSIVFRRGVIDAEANITMEPAGPYHESLRRAETPPFNGAKFRVRRTEVGMRDAAMDNMLEQLDDPFSLEDMHNILHHVKTRSERMADRDEVARDLEQLACCDYDIETTPGADLTEVVLFPTCEAEAQGMEDMRIVRFTDDDGSVRYYGTYTAFNGQRILPQIIEMPHPGLARVRTLQGRAAQNKGMALFPRRIDGHYVMSGRLDGENLFILKSHDVFIWDDAVLVQEPRFPWEFVQIGNCGSPLETEAGWLLLTHGVGAMRRYCIGATLLDRNDPTKLIGRLAEPLIVPLSEERRGYVPNVVYSCGGLIHNGLLVIPYGISDAATGFATVPLDEVLARLS